MNETSALMKSPNGKRLPLIVEEIAEKSSLPTTVRGEEKKGGEPFRARVVAAAAGRK